MLQISSCGPDADTLCIQSISFCPELRPLLDHLSVEAKGRQPLQPSPSVFLFEVPTLSKEEKQIRIKGWRKVLARFLTLTQSLYRTGTGQGGITEGIQGRISSSSSQQDWLCDGCDCQGQGFCKEQDGLPTLFVKKLKAAGGQRGMREKDR